MTRKIIFRDLLLALSLAALPVMGIIPAPVFGQDAAEEEFSLDDLEEDDEFSGKIPPVPDISPAGNRAALLLLPVIILLVLYTGRSRPKRIKKPTAPKPKEDTDET